MIKLFLIFILTLSTIIFATLFLIYYNNIDKYMKDKEVYIKNKTSELSTKENLINKYYVCDNDLKELKEKINKIKNIIG